MSAATANIDERALFNLMTKDATKDQLIECLKSEYGGEKNARKYMLIRKDAAQRLNCSLTEVDALVRIKQSQAGSVQKQADVGKELQGKAVIYPEVEPWPQLRSRIGKAEYGPGGHRKS